jgi:carboxyl-terminal processing protease
MMKTLLLYIILILSFGLHLRASEATETIALEPELMKAQTKWAINLMRSKHYIKDEINELEGNAIINSYIEVFDSSKLYFLKSDIESYQFRFGEAMEDFLKKGNLYPAFIIYEDFKKKVLTRNDWVKKRLDAPFTFKEAVSFQTDRSEVDWLENQEELDFLWEQYLKYQLLNEILSSTGEIPSLSERYKKDSSEKDAPSDKELQEQLNQLANDPDYFNEKMVDALEKIQRRYERNRKIILEWEQSDLQESFLNSITSLFDPHSSFLSSHTLEGFNSSVKNSFVGIGALLEDVDGICTIKEILPGGPAERSRALFPEDEIHGVAQGDGEFEDVVDLQLKSIVRKIKGKKGTLVRLMIKPGDSADPSTRKIVELKRDEVKLTANLASAKILYLPLNETDKSIPIGVIELPSFYGNIGLGNALATTSEDVKELITKLEDLGAEGLILDLRTNGGGLLSEAVKLTGLFLPVGPVVQVVDAKGKKQVLYDQNPEIFWDRPLIVLTSKQSASASEIVAGALQDNERALIIGDPSTHGKGTVQEVYYMNSPRDFNWFKTNSFSSPPVASKITIKQFFLPQGSSTQLKGVESDITLPSINELLSIGESEYENAIPWQSIDPVNWYNNWEKIEVSTPYDGNLIDYLEAKSFERQNTLDEFAYLSKKIDWRKKLKNETTISLNLETRIQKQLEDKNTVEALIEQYDALKLKRFKQEDIFLDLRTQQEEASSDFESSLAKDSSEDEEPFFDIHLRESARIMRDWVQREDHRSIEDATLSSVQ